MGRVKIILKSLNKKIKDKCEACRYHITDEGDVSGNEKCGQTGATGNSQDCPKYAAYGCYTGTSAMSKNLPKSLRIFSVHINN